MITLEPTETKMVGRMSEEVAKCQVVSTADINTREEACEPARYIFHFKVILSMINIYLKVFHKYKSSPNMQNKVQKDNASSCYKLSTLSMKNCWLDKK